MVVLVRLRKEYLEQELIALDPRTLGTQIDDGIMDKNLDAKLLLINKNYLLSINTN